MRPSRWWLFKRKVRRLFMSKEQIKSEQTAAINSFWACFSEEEKQATFKQFHALMKQRLETNKQ